MFFLISGFVIQIAHSRSGDQSFKTYFFKRFLRIYIPLVAVYITNYILVYLSSTKLVPVDIYDLAGNLLMLQDHQFLKPNVICGPFLGNSPLWSLSYEWWFYMIFFFSRKWWNQKARLFIYPGCLLAAIAYIPYPNFITREIVYLAIWWTGVEMAMLYQNGKPINYSTLKWPLVSLFLIAVILTTNILLQHNYTSIGLSPALELRHFLFAIVAIVVANMCQNIKWKGFNFFIMPFSRIASISFGIYISHWFLIVNTDYMGAMVLNPVVRTLIAVGLCLLYSYFIERILFLRLSRAVLLRLNRSK